MRSSFEVVSACAIQEPEVPRFSVLRLYRYSTLLVIFINVSLKLPQTLCYKYCVTPPAAQKLLCRAEFEKNFQTEITSKLNQETEKVQTITTLNFRAKLLAKVFYFHTPSGTLFGLPVVRQLFLSHHYQCVTDHIYDSSPLPS